MKERITLKLDDKIVEHNYPVKVNRNERLIYDWGEYIVMSILVIPFRNEVVYELTIEKL